MSGRNEYRRPTVEIGPSPDGNQSREDMPAPSPMRQPDVNPSYDTSGAAHPGWYGQGPWSHGMPPPASPFSPPGQGPWSHGMPPPAIPFPPPGQEPRGHGMPPPGSHFLPPGLLPWSRGMPPPAYPSFSAYGHHSSEAPPPPPGQEPWNHGMPPVAPPFFPPGQEPRSHGMPPPANPPVSANSHDSPGAPPPPYTDTLENAQGFIKEQVEGIEVALKALITHMFGLDRGARIAMRLQMRPWDQLPSGQWSSEGHCYFDRTGTQLYAPMLSISLPESYLPSIGAEAGAAESNFQRSAMKFIDLLVHGTSSVYHNAALPELPGLFPLPYGILLCGFTFEVVNKPTLTYEITPSCIYVLKNVNEESIRQGIPLHPGSVSPTAARTGTLYECLRFGDEDFALRLRQSADSYGFPLPGANPGYFM
ncbi:hypothetical protein GGR54DRAFT_594140 [Hypoxylon sp. NC1633]|nr:hypothetical protein GGR54DRAFT_594140 [Hypoxylon sp. NC1633]